MIRVLSFNLQHALPGAGAALDPLTAPLADADITDPGAARDVLSALAGQIRALEPDVVALQEVDLGQARSGRIDQAGELARMLGWEHYRFAAGYAGPVVGLRRRPWRTALTSAADEPLGPVRAALGLPPAGFGNALLSRLPVQAWHVARLGRGPAEVTRSGGRHRLDPRGYRLSTATMRTMVSARIQVPGTPGLTVASTHLATRTDVAASQLAAAWSALASLDGPHLLVGDLNLRSEHVARLGIARAVGAGATYPSGRPRHRIDHLLTDPWPVDPDGLPLRVGDAGCGPATAEAGAGLLRAVGHGTRSLVVSDHAATWADLELV